MNRLEKIKSRLAQRRQNGYYASVIGRVLTGKLAACVPGDHFDRVTITDATRRAKAPRRASAIPQGQSRTRPDAKRRNYCGGCCCDRRRQQKQSPMPSLELHCL
jgi:hypothetical protein